MRNNGSVVFNPYMERELDEKVRLVIYDNKKAEFALFQIIDPREIFELKHDDLAGHYDYKFKYQIFNAETNRWVDYGDRYKYILPEVTTEKGLKYAFYPAQSPSNFLIVCFQAIQKVPKYNYIRTLSDGNAHRLYIKDGYGRDESTRTSYYLNENNPIPVDDLVQELISNFVRGLDIPQQNTIFIGSSKGGYAGLYHGYKFGGGHIVVGGPQTKLGDYLCVYSDKSILSPIFKGIFGVESEENKAYANTLLKEVLRTSKPPYPKTYFHIGKNEPHYQKHAVPFMQWIESFNISNVEFDLADYATHKELAKHYPVFLKQKINYIIK